MGTASPRAWRAAVLSIIVVSLVVVLYRGQSSAPAEKFTAIRAHSQSLLDTSVFDTPLFPEFQNAPAKPSEDEYAEGADEAAAPVAQQSQHISLRLVTSSPQPALDAVPATSSGVAAQPQQISIELVTPPPDQDQEAGVAGVGQQTKPMQISIELSPTQPKDGMAEGSLGALVGEPTPLNLPLVTEFTSVPTLPVEAPEPTSEVFSPLTIPIKITIAKATATPIAPKPIPVAPVTEVPVAVVPENSSAPVTAPSTPNALIAHYKKEEAHWKKEEVHWERFEKHMTKMEAAHAKAKTSTALPTSPPTKVKCDDCDMLHNQLKDLKEQYTMNQRKISTQKKLMQKAHFVHRLQRLERAVAQQQVHIMWQKKQLDQVNTLESVMPALVHGTRPLWGPGSEEAEESGSSSATAGLGNEKHKISQRLLKVEKVLNSIMAKNGEAEVGNHLGISELHP